MTTSLIIPTYNRHSDLDRTLNSITKQSEKPDEVIIVIGPNDHESFDIVAKYKFQYSIKAISIDKKSVVAALNIGLTECKGDIVCLTDDDVELSVNWIRTIKSFFNKNPYVGAYGGPDNLIISNDKKNVIMPPQKKIGVFKLFSMIGNHHCGAIDNILEVDFLKGVNLSINKVLLGNVKIDSKLESFGAEIGWEIDICSFVKARGFKIIYDNSNYLTHYVGKRQSDDIRNDIFSKANYYRTFNMVYLYKKYRPTRELIIFLFKDYLIGSNIQPGLLRSIIYINNIGFKVIFLSIKKIHPIIKALSN